MRRLAWLSLIFGAAAAMGACTFDGLDAYDQPDAAADATLDVSTADPDAGQADAAPKDAALLDVVAVKDACVGCYPIHCADAGTCTGPGQVCCAHVTGSFADSGLGTLGGYACVASNACGKPTDVPIACSGPESCTSGRVCCGANSPYRQGNLCFLAGSTACQTTCNPGEFVVGCATSTDCPDGGTCAISTCTIPGFPICK